MKKNACRISSANFISAEAEVVMIWVRFYDRSFRQNRDNYGAIGLIVTIRGEI